MRAKFFWAIASGMLMIFMFGAMPSAEAKGGDFFWTNKAYGRGVGTIPPGSCPSGEVEDAGLCYKPCREGYHGVGPVCWENNPSIASYGRGAGTIPHITWNKHKFKFESSCRDGKENDAGLCYDNCRDGYHGVGPVCHSKNGPSYGRGVGRAEKFNCPAGKENDAGLCYDQCRDGYAGVGPVCWGKPPPGYVFCGMGFASNANFCGGLITAQVAATGFLINDLAGMAGASDAYKLPKAIEKYGPLLASGASVVVKNLGTLTKIVQPVIKSMEHDVIKLANGKISAAEAMRRIATLDRPTLEKMIDAYADVKKELKKYDGPAHTHDSQKTNYKASIIKAMGPQRPIDIVREVAGVLSMIPGSVGGAVLSGGNPETAPGFAQQWSYFSDFMWVLSVYAWPEYGQ